jgi:ATP-dependent Clp protease, protease subunit
VPDDSSDDRPSTRRRGLRSETDDNDAGRSSNRRGDGRRSLPTSTRGSLLQGTLGRPRRPRSTAIIFLIEHQPPSGRSTSTRAIIFLGTPVDEINVIMAQLLHLESEDPDKDIALYINSPGGSITSLFAIYDTMEYIKPGHPDDLHGPGRLGGGGAARRRHPGQALRAAALAHPAAPALRRAEGQASDIEIVAREILRMRDLLNEILAEKTGQTVERIERTPTGTSS